MALAVLGIALVGSILGLDRTAAGQFMVSQPIVAGPITGWMLGDPAAGLAIGAILELLWVLDLPVGTFVPANTTICTVSATAAAALGHPGGASPADFGFSILLTTIMVPITMKADSLVRTLNSRLGDSVLASSGQNMGRALSRAQGKGLLFFFLKSFVLYCLLVPPSIAAVGLFAQMPSALHRAASLFVRLLPLLGVALVLRKLSMRTFDRFFLVGCVFAAIFGEVEHVPAPVILILSAAAGWVGAEFLERRS